MDATRSRPKGVATQDCSALDDDALLSAFLKNGDEAAFKALATRHARWLYAAAFRQLRDRHLAEDATQAVFVLLWQRAGSVAGKRKVTGWLFRAVGYTARAMKRAERRRRKYESRAALVNRTPSNEPPPTQCRDVDAAVAALGDADRTAILLRYYRGLGYVDVARELGLSPAAARQRVSRAIDRLRAKLGREVGSSVLASAVAYGAPPSATSFGERAADAALGVARGVALGGGVEHALKGAVRLMAISKAKAVVAFAALAAVLVTSAVAVTTGRPADDPSDRVYALGQGEAIRQVQSVPTADRLEFLRRHSFPGDRLDHPEGAMIVKWQDGRASLWGRKSSSQGWYTLGDLVGHFLGVPPHQFEGRQALRNLRLSGDFVVDRKAATEQYRAGIEKIVSAELGRKAVLVFRDVERPVVVFRGKWSHSPAEPGAKPSDGVPTLDLYGRNLRPLPGRDAAGTPDEVAVAASNYVGQQVLFDCQGAPEQVRVRSSDPTPGNPLAGLPAADVDLVLRHIEEQTGLKATREDRKVRRLFVEAD